jgi:hypothetical protein
VARRYDIAEQDDGTVAPHHPMLWNWIVKATPQCSTAFGYTSETHKNVSGWKRVVEGRRENEIARND